MQCYFISEGRQWPWLEGDISFIIYVLSPVFNGSKNHLSFDRGK